MTATVKGRSGEHRRILRAIEEAGGEVETTKNGHVKVTGPDGIAFIGDPNNGRQGGRAWHNTIAEIKRRTGLALRLR